MSEPRHHPAGLRDTDLQHSQPPIDDGIDARALLAAIVDSSDDAIVAKSLTGTIVSWNSAAERLFGYSAAEAIGQPITLIIPPELHDEERSILERLRRGEKIEHFETVRVARDGRRIDISLTISPVRDARGQVIGASKIARDITDRKRAEERLRESEQRLRQVLDALPAAIYTTDADGRITHYNPACVDLAGRTPRPGVDEWCVSWKLEHPDGSPLPHDQCPMAVALKEARTITGAEIVVERPDGSRAWAAAYPTPLLDPAGKVTGGINMLVDITTRKQMEEALRDETRIAETLNRLGRTLAAELDLERVVQVVTDEATAVSTAGFGAFFYNQVGGEGDAYSLYALSGAPREAFAAFPMPRKTPIFEPTFRGEGIIRIDDVTRDPRYGRNAPYAGMPPGHLPVRSYLAVPVISRSGEVLGGLFLGHPQAGVFTERHERIVASIAAHAAIAIDNARLYTRVQESEQRFRQLAEHATDVFWIVEVPARRMLYVSPAYQEVWGRSCRSLYDEPTTFLDAVHPGDRQRILGAMERQIAGHTTAEEYRVVHPDGTLRWVWDRAFPIRDEWGAVVRIAGIAEDITERKVAEDRLRDGEERYRRLTELLPVAVYACEAPTGVITFYNERAVELWGREPDLDDPGERFCGSARLLLPDGSHLPRESCPMAVALREGRSFRNQEVVVERPDGSRITVLVNIEPIMDADNRVVAAINACLDVSALKEAEQRLKEADRRKDEFLATLSHELRNPLAPLRYALELIEQANDDGRLLRQSRAILERQVGQMVRLIDDLLDVSRISHDKLELCLEPVNVADVVLQAVETCRPLIEQGRHTLDLRLPDEPVELRADSVRLTQVLGNLLSNACKYTDPGGHIDLCAERHGEEVIITVTDTGVGIASVDLEHIFEMFTQADRNASRHQRGLGVGLTLVKRLVEMHRGSVSARSEGEGKGSTFAVRLPVAGQAAPSRPTKPGQSADRPPRASPRRVLVVDDNADAAASLSMLLTLAGHEAERAHDGPEAIAAAKSFQPHVVLLDLGLPTLDGYEVCRAIRREPWGRDVTIVALTGWGQEEDRRRSRDAGFDEHLVKPVEHPAIERLLASLDT